MKIGAIYSGSGKCSFSVWAPFIDQCTLRVVSPAEIEIPMQKDNFGYFKLETDNIPAGSRYYYVINDDKAYPDPASGYQPEGVHGPSEVIDHSSYKWKHKPDEETSLNDLIIYEIHTGTFTNEGTFRAAEEKLSYLKELGITAVEIMPVAQYPGNRNWGYDGVNIFAPQNSYGRPEDMKHFIDECHKHEIKVILDVVYNHFGPEGNYLSKFAPYFTSNYKTPWGDAINFDHEYSDHVRNYFFQNAVYWLTVYNIDGLRLDAIDRIYDMSAKHFLAELSETVENLGANNGKKFVIAESDLNDIKVIKPLSQGGYGCNAQWSDDFHHSVHALLTGENGGYYIDFGKVSHLVTAYTHSFVYSGKYSEYRKRRHGNSAAERPAQHFVVSVQNHDQVGNRPYGKRLSNLISFEGLKLAAGALLLSPYIPLLFMGEEYGEENPFIYFISHEDMNLVKAVQEGRRNEFSSFNWGEDIPDPYSDDTFHRTKLNWPLLREQRNHALFSLYKELINCRKTKPALRETDRKNLEAHGIEDQKIILLHRWNSNDNIFIIMNFNKETVTSLINVPEGKWKKLMDSASEKWMGPGESTPAQLLSEQQNITIKGSSFTMYEIKENYE